MKKLLIIKFTLMSIFCVAQERLPVLKTNSDIVNIQDGNVLYLGGWRVSSETRWDEYFTGDVEDKKIIKFFSATDTLVFIVEPNKKYDFIVLLNNKKAYTRINTDATKEPSNARINVLQYRKKRKNNSYGKDTIPFRIGDDNRIHMTGTINGSDSLDLLFDTGANGFAITSSLIGNRVTMTLDGKTLNKGSDGVSIKKTSSNNTFEINNLIWNNARFTSIDYKKPRFDGVIGWPAFGGKIVEIDYEKKIMILHQSLEKIPVGYAQVQTAMIQEIPYIRAEMTINNKKSYGWFEFDTGGARSFYLSKHYVTKNKLDYTHLDWLGTSHTSGSKGVGYKRNIYRLPKLKFGEFETYQLPIAIAEEDPKGVFFNDILGNDLLKRFNAIIDFEKYEIYLKPNALLHSKYGK